MLSLIQQLADICGYAFQECGQDKEYGQVAISQRQDLGQFQCNGALLAASKSKESPRQIAQCVVDILKANGNLAKVDIAGPGFINISLEDEFLARHLQNMRQSKVFGYQRAHSPRNVVIDYGGPNVAKPMHVGHLRSSIIGESLKRLFRFAGDKVIGDIHLGDWGTQMGMIITELQRRQPHLPYFDGNYSSNYPTDPPITIEELEEMYPTANKRCKSDSVAMEAAKRATVELQQGRPGYRALWQHFVDVSVAALKEDFDQLGVSFELWLGESDADPWILPLVERLKKDGYAQHGELDPETGNYPWVIPIAEEDDNRLLPPMMLVKSDGGVLYSTTDLATIYHRVHELNAEIILYVVDARQSDHFEQVFRAAFKTDIAPKTTVLEHVAFGTVNDKSGKPFKTRAGGVMKLKDLMELIIGKAFERMEEAKVAETYGHEERREIARMVGLAALKFGDLINHRTKDYIFDLDRFSSFEGRTGPYLLYSAIRAKSIIRNASEMGINAGILQRAIVDSERTLYFQIAQLPDVLNLTYDTRAPNHLADYAYNLAVAYNRFYGDCHILREKDHERQASWLGLSELFLAVLAQVLDILGIELPDRM